jgi:Zn finger protein HypA/HybF involved in hydrogenase expression
MDENRLDGNAAGGLLGEIFAFEMTSAQAACAGCGAVWRVGQTMVYAHELGTIVRCANCDNAMIRVGRGPGRYLLDMRGVRYLQAEEA